MHQPQIKYLNSPEELAHEVLQIATEKSSLFVLCDSNTMEHCWPVLGTYEPFTSASLLQIPPGEESKDIEIVYQLWRALLEQDADRNSLVVNLGGGMVADLGGFVASTFKRGVDYVHMPTSLLAMVDAAIGGKTGINLDHSKNQVGTFSRASATLTWTGFLNTLPQRELRSGFAEMLKHGIVGGGDILDPLTSLETLTTDSLSALIKDSAGFKENIVADDFKESGKRKVLNFGHTVGHGLESLFMNQPEPLLHGEAIAFGMIVELLISRNKGLLASGHYDSLSRLISRFFDPIKIDLSSHDSLMSFIKSDKKNEGDSIRMVLLAGPGQPLIDQEVAEAEIVSALEELSV